MDYEAMYRVWFVETLDDGRVRALATLEDSPSNRVAVCASDSTVFGWEYAADVSVEIVLTRPEAYVKVGDVIKIQSSHKPSINPRSITVSQESA